MRGIEQVCVGRGFERGCGTPGIALVAPQQIGQDLLLAHRLAPRLQFERAACGAHFRAGDHEQFDVGARRNDRADIAAVEHRARRLVANWRW